MREAAHRGDAGARRPSAAIDGDVSVPALVRWALASGHLSPAALGALRVEERAGRHRSLRVASERGGVFIKAPRPLAASADHEALVLGACPPSCVVAPLATRADGALLFPLLERHRTWRELVAPSRDAVLSALGGALAELHRVRAAPPAPIPRIFDVLRRGDAGEEGSAAQRALRRRLASWTELHRALVALRARWRPRALIHGDLRPENVLVRQDPARFELRLVDLEAGGLGEPAWDLGCVAAEHLAATRLGAASAPTFRSEGPAFEAFLAAYGGPDLALSRVSIEGHAGARLIQIAFEESATQSRLDARAFALAAAGAALLCERDASVRAHRRAVKARARRTSRGAASRGEGAR